jgi:DNA processing protein
LIVSEYSLGTPPLAPNFPLRNRIIAGLSRGTLVVEAALQSGSLITARLAVEGGREVFAIPGSIHAPQSKGCHALIKQGKLESARDISKNWAGQASRLCSVTAAAHPIVEAMGYEPISLDELVRGTGWSAAELNVRLLELELGGVVARLPGQCFQRIGQG